LRVVDYPSMTLGNFRRRPAEPAATWDPRIAVLNARVVLGKAPSPFDRLSWRRTGAAIERALPATRGRRRVVLATTPLWAPVLRFLSADRRGFDAVDDLRALPSVAHIRGHVVAGYRAVAADAGACTAVSETLAERLRADFGIAAHAVRNGVDLAPYRGAAPAPPGGVPASPFAVYVGVVQQRVDLDLLVAARAVMPVVVAGPADDAAAAVFARAGVTWLGPIPQSSVPALLRAAAVGLVPHREDALTSSMDPMKVREYLAAGLPVVTTVAPPTELMTPRVLRVPPDAFADGVRHAAALGALGAPDPDAVHRTWSDVASELFAEHVAR
jgi:glycosyltransferase involved in cell wall biosynthesis